MNKDILNLVDEYYSKKILDNGASSEGVDWNSIESHYLRFDQLTQNIDKNDSTSILDYGCGYGALVDYLKKNEYSDFNYTGYDISEEMIKKGKEIYGDQDLKFYSDIKNIESTSFDYCLANGIFNVRLDVEDEKWTAYVLETLDKLNKFSTKGFSFNILSKYSDKEFMRDYLFYADPLFFFDYCKINFAKNITLLHDYDLYEFTILVKK